MDKKELLDRIHNLKTLGSVRNIKQVLLGLLNLGDKEEVHNLQEITDKGSVTTNDIIVIDEINGVVTTISSGGVVIGGEVGKSHGINSNPLGTVVSYGEGGDSNYLIIEKDKAVFSKPVQGVDAIDIMDYVTKRQIDKLPQTLPTLQEVTNKGSITTTPLQIGSIQEQAYTEYGPAGITDSRVGKPTIKAVRSDTGYDTSYGTTYFNLKEGFAEVSKELRGKVATSPTGLPTLSQVEGLIADISTETPTLQEVLNKGNTATGAIEAEEGVFNKIILGQWEISVDADGSLITTAIP